ncbi:putative terpene synthase 13 [Acorus gramineus]|uniref:Terpene synthase 13 n=1 Tax=Acorus gramineus TaxID=55184 RepID=A0AAV9BBA5_ACOGR|nr:putative terpene synthase 13 [Acorus gramineus]
MQEISRWWKDLGLAEQISFARDRPSEWFMWAMTMLSEPQFSRHRIELMKPVSLIYIIDDIFDVYGTLDELMLFTEAIKRWDIASIDLLPSHMKICCMALHNITNEIAYFVYKEHRWNPIDSLRRAWGELCDAFLVEARWYASGHIPKPEEYLKSAVISSAMHMLCVNIFFLLGEQITKESIDYLEGHPTIISSPAMILRLVDDLGKAKDGNQEGFDGSYLECYLKENPNSSVENAKKHMKGMILDAWKRLNKECLSSPEPFSRRFAQSSLNGARLVRTMYDYDGHFPENQVNSLLYN